MKTESPEMFLTKQELAHRHLRKQILEGKAKPGERIIIDSLASELGMSPIPVREAISQLAREGLLTLRPHAGAIVSDIPVEAIEEIFALLESLEIAAARLALPKLAPTVLTEMETICARMEQATDPLKWARLNRDFHESLPRLNGLERILEMLVKAGQDWERLRKLRYNHNISKDIEQSNIEHRHLLAHLREGQAAQVEDWIRHHNRSALMRYLQQ